MDLVDFERGVFVCIVFTDDAGIHVKHMLEHKPDWGIVFATEITSPSYFVPESAY